MKLNDQQLSAANHREGPALVLAGPGSGKTTVITARTWFLIKTGVSPENILTLVFNKSAQIEMKHRFNAKFPEAGYVHFATFHSFCYSIVRDYETRQGKHLKLIEGGSGHTDVSKTTILKGLYREINSAHIQENELETLVNEIGYVKNSMNKSLEGLEFETKNFQQILKAYEAFKKEQLLMDFDDMLGFAYAILVRCTDLLDKYRQSYQYFQVDEAQDLSKNQFEILKLLIPQKSPNLFMVADDDQSIYRFRGAEPESILRLGEVYPDCKLFKLECNFRSSKNIVDLSSRFIKRNKQRFDKNHFTANGAFLDPQIVQVADRSEQRAFITKTIKDLSSLKQSIKIGILYRNGLSAVPVADFLDRNSIPFKARQNKLYYENHWMTQDIRAFLNLSLNPSDQEALHRIYYKMNGYFTKVLIESSIKNLHKHNLWDTMFDLCEDSDMKKTIRAYKKEFQKIAHMLPIKALNRIEDYFKYFTHVKEACQKNGQSFDSVYRIFGILREIARSCRTVAEFLQRMDELPALLLPKRAEGTPSNVTLSTLHASKGLEYDIVFMIDLFNDELPGLQALSKAEKEKDDRLLEEERRLFYVGMTRAKKWLYLVTPAERAGLRVDTSTFVSETAALLNRFIEDKIAVGSRICHQKYGNGIVVKVNVHAKAGTIIEADFGGKFRSLDLKTCIDNNIIKLTH